MEVSRRLAGLVLALSALTNDYSHWVDTYRVVSYFPLDQQVRAFNIFWCESSGNRFAVGSQGEAGIPQIHPIHWEHYKVTMTPLQDPDIAGLVARDIYDQSLYYTGDGWTPWSCR